MELVLCFLVLTDVFSLSSKSVFGIDGRLTSSVAFMRRALKVDDVAALLSGLLKI